MVTASTALVDHVPVGVRKAYERWLHRRYPACPDPSVSVETFASIYRIGAEDAIKLSGALSPHLAMLAELIDFCRLESESKNDGEGERAP